jgi:putative ABC transport system permease protein
MPSRCIPFCSAYELALNRLGAAPRQLFALVLGQSMLPIALGLLAGLVLSLLLTPLLSSLLFGVRPTDILTFVIVALVLSTAGLIACLLPVRRAMRVDPMIALRYE